MRLFKVGDRVRIAYDHDGWKHNGEIGVITWVNTYNHYPNRNESLVEKRQQGVVTYKDGGNHDVGYLHRKGCGILSPVELIKAVGEKQESEVKQGI